MIDKDTNILVVDDEEVVCKSCYRVLADEGYKVTTVTKGVDALKIAETKSFDIAFLDIKMPRMNGLSVLDRLKSDQPDLEAIIITGYPSLETIKQAVTLGASDYISKPLEPKIIINAASEALGRRKWGIHKYSLENNIMYKGINGNHSQFWMANEDNGEIRIGMKGKYLESLGALAYIELPLEGDKIEAGQTLFKMLTLDQKIHEFKSPLDGYVASVNYDLLGDINLLTSNYCANWVIILKSGE